jgi:hypothetical protein
MDYFFDGVIYPGIKLAVDFYHGMENIGFVGREGFWLAIYFT